MRMRSTRGHAHTHRPSPQQLVTAARHLSRCVASRPVRHHASTPFRCRRPALAQQTFFNPEAFRSTAPELCPKQPLPKCRQERWRMTCELSQKNRTDDPTNNGNSSRTMPLVACPRHARCKGSRVWGGSVLKQKFSQPHVQGGGLLLCIARPGPLSHDRRFCCRGLKLCNAR